ncbi:MAG: hypothetical protein DRJ47_11185, partial [Thermoprotei archaeon]
MKGLLFVLVTLTLLSIFPAPAKFTYSLGTTRLVAGAVNNVRIVLKNIGFSTAAFVNVRLSPSTPGVAILSPPVVFDKVAPGRSVSFNVRIAVNRAVYGSIAMVMMQVIYRDFFSATLFTDTFTLGFQVAEISRLELMKVDREGERVVFKLRNTGPVPIHNVSLSLLDGGIVGDPPMYRLSVVEVNETVSVIFTLRKNYDYITLRIIYNDGWVDELRTALPKPNYRVSIVSVMRKGEDVRVRIRNEGSLDLKNITLLIKYAGVLVGTPYRVTIPFIAAGDEAEAVFRVQAGLDTLTIRLEYPNGYSEEETVSVSIDKAASVDIRCLFPERRVDLGSKTSFPIWLVNKGGAGIYTFKVKGLPSSIDYRFIRDDVEVGAVYLEDGGQAMIALETVIPSVPVNFTVGEVIDFYVNVFTEDGELAGSARLKLIPVISRGL